MAPCFIKDDDILNEKVLIQSSAFLGADSLFEGHENVTFFINNDSTGFYIFTMSEGNPVAKWVRRDRNTDNIAVFTPTFTKDVPYSGDRVNGYKLDMGLYADMGTGTPQAG